jgi:hypothetical protein
MHRLTARLLLLFAIVGSVAPIAMAAAAAPIHACCVRKGVHRCHDSLGNDSLDHVSLGPESGERTVRDTSCCSGGGHQASISNPWAHTQAQAASHLLPAVAARIAGSQPDSPVDSSTGFQSTRAPPAC